MQWFIMMLWWIWKHYLGYWWAFQQDIMSNLIRWESKSCLLCFRILIFCLYLLAQLIRKENWMRREKLSRNLFTTMAVIEMSSWDVLLWGSKTPSCSNIVSQYRFWTFNDRWFVKDSFKNWQKATKEYHKGITSDSADASLLSVLAADASTTDDSWKALIRTFNDRWDCSLCKRFFQKWKKATNKDYKGMTSDSSGASYLNILSAEALKMDDKSDQKK